MTASKVPFIKLPAPLIKEGYWSKMSAAARTLYPVLLSFSDGNYKDSWPGTKRLLELTGFKQKSSLRKAREELRELGLITYSLGTGRTNTTYRFHAPWGAKNNPSEACANTPVGASLPPLTGGSERRAGENLQDSRYNQIQISINNHPSIGVIENSSNGVDETRKNKQEKSDLTFLKERFGEAEVNRAQKECKLGGIAPNRENLERILYAHPEKVSQIEQLYSHLESRISTGSLHLIQNAFLREENGLLYFTSFLPMHLQHLLLKTSFQVIIEPKLVSQRSEIPSITPEGVGSSVQRL